MNEMKDCKRYPTCNANLCPLDPDMSYGSSVSLRTWTPGEDICKRSEFKDLPWIKRQKKLNRTRPRMLEGEALSLDYLIESAPLPRKLSPEHREAAVARLKVYQMTRKVPC